MAVRRLTVKERILLHLFDYNRFVEEYEVPEAATQSGLAEGVGIRVHHVSQYVKPLIEEELVEGDTRHIQGGSRRRKVYFLTPAGQHRVASLRAAVLDQEVPFRRASGEQVSFPLTRIYQQERRGTRLIELLRELDSSGYVGERPSTTATGVVDLSQEAPPIERFHGRKDELKAVLQVVGQIPALVVSGMAGIGKTTLGSQVCKELRGRRSLLWRRVRPWDTSRSLGLHVAAFLGQTGRPGLGRYLTAAGAKELTRVEEILSVDFQGVKSLLIFDDVHTASEDANLFLELLYGVMKSQKGNSVLLLSRTLPGFYSRRDVDVDATVLEIPLTPLDSESARAILGDAGVSEARSDRLIELSGGSPLFLKILARSRTPLGAQESWDALDSYIAEEIEPSLEREEVACLHVASLYELPVPPEGLLLESRGGLGTVVDLQRRGLLERAEGGRVLLHDSLRDYFRRGLPGERRENLVQKVVSWLTKEAEKAEGERRRDAAIALLENAVQIEVEPRRRVLSLELLGETRRSAADFLGALDTFRTALRVVTEDADKARLHRRIATCLFLVRKLEETEEEIDRGMQLLSTDPSLDLAWLLTIRANVAFVKADFRAARLDLDAVMSWNAELPEDSALALWVARLNGVIRSWYPRPREFGKLRNEWRRVFELTRASTDRPSDLYFPLLWLALGTIESGETDEGIEQLQRTVDLGEAAGRVDLHPLALLVQGWCLLEYRGDNEAAEASLERSLAMFRESPSASWRIPWCYRHFTDLYWRQGRLEEARESLEHFLKTAPLARSARIENLALMARLCVEGGDVDTAKAYLQEATDLRSRDASSESAYFLEWAEAAVKAHQGEPEKADSHFLRALSLEIPPPVGPGNMVEMLASTRNPGELLLDFGRFLIAEGRLERAEEVLGQARDEFGRLNRKPRQSETEELLGSIRSDA